MKHLTFSRGRGVACTAALLAGLACAAPGVAGATTEPAADATATSTGPCTEPGEYDTEGEFVYSFTTDLRSFDPDFLGSGADMVYLWPLYDTLIYEGPTGDLSGLLAESWSVADDGSSITFTLREGVTFHDGTPIDAEAVKANLDRSRTIEGGAHVEALSSIEEVVVVSPTEVELKITGDAPGIVLSLASAAGMMKSPAVFDLDHLEIARTGGSGAFQLGEVVSGVSTEYTRVADYWDNGNSWGFGTFRVEIINDANARLNAVVTGQVDAALGGASINRAAEEAGLLVCKANGISATAIQLNTARSEFGNQLVRQALAHAIDREGIAAQILTGSCTANSQRFPTWHHASNPEIPADYYDYNLDKARELLAEAGLEDGFEFDIHVPSDSGAYIPVAEVIQQALAEIDVTMNIVPSELHTILQDFRSGNADAHMAPLVVSEPASYLESFYLEGGINNPGNFQAEGMAELFEELSAATSTEEQAPIFAEIATIATEQAAPIVTICNLDLNYIVSPEVGGLQVYYNNSRQFRTVTAD